jgi:hypothetical protein
MLLRSAWYSPALYLRQHRAADERLTSVYDTRNIDTAVPAEAPVRAPFLVRLWIRRPETPTLTEEQLRAELGVPDRVAVSMRTSEADIKFEPVAGRKLRRGEVIIRLTSPACEVVPASIKLFVDEHLDAPPAIFTVKAIQPGPAALIFSVWQEGGQIASVSHLVQVVDAAKQPRAGIRAGSSAIPMQAPAPPWGVPWSPRPGAEPVGPSTVGQTVFSPLAPTATTVITPEQQFHTAAPAAQSRHDLRRWLGMVAMLWIVSGFATSLPTALATRRYVDSYWADHPLMSALMGTPMAIVTSPSVTATPSVPGPVATPVVEHSPPIAPRVTSRLLRWPTLALAFITLQIIMAALYWRKRRNPGVGRWLPATLLVGFLSLLVGIVIAILSLLL